MIAMLMSSGCNPFIVHGACGDEAVTAFEIEMDNEKNEACIYSDVD